MTATERLVERSIRDQRFAAAMFVLLDELREHIQVVGISREAHARADDYVAEWVESVTEGGPILTVIHAMRERPILWRDAIPEELVLVPRKLLQAVVASVPISPTLGSLCTPTVESLEYAGNALMEQITSVRSAQREEREDRAEAERTLLSRDQTDDKPTANTPPPDTPPREER